MKMTRETIDDYRTQEQAWKEKYSRVKCDCGHYMRDHYADSGCCNKCGCTWYWPNVEYIKRKAKEGTDA